MNNKPWGYKSDIIILHPLKNTPNFKMIGDKKGKRHSSGVRLSVKKGVTDDPGVCNI